MYNDSPYYTRIIIFPYFTHLFTKPIARERQNVLNLTERLHRHRFTNFNVNNKRFLILLPSTVFNKNNTLNKSKLTRKYNKNVRLVTC